MHALEHKNSSNGLVCLMGCLFWSVLSVKSLKYQFLLSSVPSPWVVITRSPKSISDSSVIGTFREKQSKSSVLLRCHWVRDNPQQRHGLVCYILFSTSECLGYCGDGKYLSAWRDWSMKLSAAKTGHFQKKNISEQENSQDRRWNQWHRKKPAWPVLSLHG